MMEQVAAVVAAVIEAKKRVPDQYKGTSFFSMNDLWHYIDTTADSECETCRGFHGFDFTGNQLRSYFPDLEIETDTMISPNVHKTLWGADTCKCFLFRVTDNPDFDEPSKSVVYLGDKIKPYKPKPKNDDVDLVDYGLSDDEL